MNNYYLFPFLILFFYIINYAFIKNNILLDKIESSNHKKFLISYNVPLSGGILILIGIIFFTNEITILDKILFSSIFFIGLLSDLQKLKSPLIRLFLQFITILIILILNKDFDIQIRASYIDYLLQNYIFLKILFTLFCLLILINGSNFIDGLNGLCSGYYIVVIINIFIVSLKFDLTYDYNNLWILLQFLITFLIFNLLSKSFLGDSGSYLISTYIGLFLIFFFDEFKYLISPYFICLLLWYPAFENLFSIIRRKFVKKSFSTYPDNEHLHHFLFRLINKNIKNIKLSNSFSGIMINVINFIFIYIGTNFINSSKILIFLIVFLVSLYLISYFVLKNNFNK